MKFFLPAIVALVGSLLGYFFWKVSRRNSRIPVLADGALFVVLSALIGSGVGYALDRALNLRVILDHSSSTAGFAVGLFFSAMFLLASFGVGAFLSGFVLMLIRRRPG